MKLNPKQSSTPQQISDEEVYAYFEATTSDWTEAQELYDDWQRSQMYPYNLKVPKPPTPEAVEKAQFKDKTYRWNGR